MPNTTILAAGPANASLTLTLSDVLTDLGGISPQRLRSTSLQGIEDLARAHAEGVSCELVDGLLVEKAMGFRESLIASILIELLSSFVRQRKFGVVSGPVGFVQLFPSLVRGPDVAYISWDRLPGRQLPTEAYPLIAPELVVEVLSPGNTRAEMARKRREYFQAGGRLVWMVDPLRRSVAVFTTPTQYVVLLDNQTLDGGIVLSGLSISLAELFSVLDGPDAVETEPTT